MRWSLVGRVSSTRQRLAPCFIDSASTDGKPGQFEQSDNQHDKVTKIESRHSDHTAKRSQCLPPPFTEAVESS
ncbi:unnamed protein product [Soboliphyme baturini]|uniref:Secreted protein n=1 Tax=Soboliphyme baturini TaxID=241478 RepID=A0A183IWG7_9BILA|nr:unnamed protein product [Soboliphyme baturini]